VGRVGALKLLIGGLCLGGALSIFQASLPGFYTMLATRFVEGVSHLAIVVAAPTLIAQITSGKGRNISMVLWSTFFGVAFALNAWIGLPVVEHFGLPFFFALHGGLMIAIAGLILLCGLKVQPSQDVAPWRWSDLFDVHLRTYRSPFVSAPAIGWFFYTLTFVSLLAILPGRLSEGHAATVAGFMPLAGIVLSWVAVPILLSRMSCVAVVNLGFALGMFAIAGVFLGVPLELVCVCLFAVLGLVQGGSFAAVPILNHTPETQALSYGAMAQMGNAGNLLGTPVLLAVLGRMGETGMLITVIGIYAAAILAHVSLARKRALRQPA
jgi:MFS family permease